MALPHSGFVITDANGKITRVEDPPLPSLSPGQLKQIANLLGVTNVTAEIRTIFVYRSEK